MKPWHKTRTAEAIPGGERQKTTPKAQERIYLQNSK